jgi:diguanylate cyclase (GGDEF)-like protein
MVAGGSIRGAALGSQTAATALAVLIALAAADCIGFAIWPPSATAEPAVLVATGGILAVVAGVTLWALPRLNPWFLDVWVAALTVTLAVGALMADSASGQMATAMGLCLLATFSGYFLPSRHLAVQVGAMVILYAAVALASPHLGSPVYAATVVVTIISLAWMAWRVSAMLAAAAVRDPLTGVLNRRGLTEAATLMHSLTLRVDRRTSVVAIDLNDFKGYNDRHGHAAGDTLLTDLVNAWSQTLRSTDIIARTGGDEFALVLSDTDAAAAHSLLARLHEVSRSQWSAGVVEWNRGEALVDVLRRADQALYLAKTHRR